VDSERSNSVFQDYYEVLQLSRKADSDTIDRVYRLLVKRFHPDNQETGDPHKFAEVVEAYRVLSDPEMRAAFDVHYEANNQTMIRLFEEAENVEGFDGDRRTFDTILSLLYVARRRDPARGGLGSVQMERMLDRPAQYLEFHLWYLREKGWVERLESGLFAITANGVDRVMHIDNVATRRDRLISDRSTVERTAIKEHAVR
jgi:curved DNA-binding protein